MTLSGAVYTVLLLVNIAIYAGLLGWTVYQSIRSRFFAPSPTGAGLIVTAKEPG